MFMSAKKYLFRFFVVLLALLGAYGIGRLYFQLTGGFTIGNISSDFAYQPAWEVRPLSQNENLVVEKALNQPYRYLGKGCQSYVFESEDGQYVIKFFKYQRFRLQSWIAYFPPLPAMVKFREQKAEKKWRKLDSFVRSWKVAFENLKDETGLIFVHLNKTSNLNKTLTIYDKLGLKHQVELDQMEFCVQCHATMLCDALMKNKEQGNLQASKQLIDDLLAMVLSEYSRGLADNDHALMQNTGVANGKPIHIDVGQFVINERARDPEYYNLELLTKTYKFKIWLVEHYPEAAAYLDARLHEIIGPEYPTMTPIWRNKHWGS